MKLMLNQMFPLSPCLCDSVLICVFCNRPNDRLQLFAVLIFDGVPSVPRGTGRCQEGRKGGHIQTTPADSAGNWHFRDARAEV